MKYRFSDLVLDTELRQLRRGDEAIKLTKLTYKVLKALLESAPNVIQYDELVNKAWGEGRVVTPENITQRIMVLRQSLGDDATNPRYIEGLHGVGLRIIPEVTVLSVDASAASNESDSSEGHSYNKEQSKQNNSRRIKVLSAFGVLVALSILVFPALFKDNNVQRISNQESQKDTSSPTKVENVSIAVLPFVNMSSDPQQEYFSDGITEEILNSLAQNKKLKVTSRTSSFVFKDTKVKLSEIAEQLGVKNILEGSIRRDADKIRITAQLIDARTDTHLWSKTYERKLNSIFAIQDEISAAIVSSLLSALDVESPGLPLSSEAIDVRYSDNRFLSGHSTNFEAISTEAYDLYLQGLSDLHAQTFESLEQAVKHFSNALKLEPNFLQAKVKLAATYHHQILTGSRFDKEILETVDTLLINVLERDDSYADAYQVSARLARLRKDFKGAAVDIEKAYGLSPNNVSIILDYAREFGSDIGETKTRELFNRARQLDPLNANIPYYYALYLQDTLQSYTEAEIAFKQASKLNPNIGDYTFFLGWLNSSSLGNLVAAIHYAEVTWAKDLSDPDEPRFLSGHYLSLGEGSRALDYADQSIALVENNADAIDAKVNALIFLNRKDDALKLIEETLDNPNTAYRRVSKSKFVSRGVFLFLSRDDIGNADEAEKFFTRYLPDVKEVVNEPPPKSLGEVGDIEGILSLVAIYRDQKNTQAANEFVERLALIKEDTLLQGRKKLRGVDYLKLAYLSAARQDKERAIQYLETSVNNGNLHDWRSDILESPVFLILQKHPRFIAFIENLEAEMVKQKLDLKGKTLKF